MHQKRLYTRPLLIVLPSLIYTLLYASVLIWSYLKAQSEAGTDITFKFALDLFFSFAYTWALFFTIRCLSAPVFAVLLPLLFLTSALAAYYIHSYQVTIGPDLIGVLLEAQPTLALSFLTTQLLLWLLLSLGVSAALVHFCLRREQPDPKDKMVLFVSGMFVFTALFMDGGISRQYMPYNYLLAAADFFIDKTGQGAAPKIDIAQEPAQLRKDTPENLVMVVVIGESVRPDHFQLNGYKRDTNPYLAKRSNIYSFDDAPSCGPFTRNALPCILTRASYLEPDESLKETSLISLFKKLGFHTAWIDMHGMVSSVFNSPVVQVMKESDQLISFNTDVLLKYQYDEALLPVVDNLLKEQPGRLLLVLHPFGSHWPYDKRYPENFRKFTPTCSNTTPVLGDFKTTEDMESCDRDALINAYDNTLVYTDYVVNEVMKRIENRPALLVYTSDHGQSLGEGGYFLHGHTDSRGNGPAIERRVPIVWWASQPYLRAHPQNIGKIAEKAKAHERITHDSIFHSVLDCAGVESKLVNPNLSVCR